MNNLSLDELAEKGNQFYLDKLASELEPKHNGEYVVIEVGSGDYYLDTDVMQAIKKAREAHPQTLFHIVQVGQVSRTARTKVTDNAWLF